MAFQKVAARYPLWNPHYKGQEKNYAGKSGDFLRGRVLKVRTEGIGENMGAMLDVKIVGKAYEGVKPGATLNGKDVRTLAGEMKGAEIVSWPISNKYVKLVEDLSGAEGHFLEVIYGGQAKSKYDNPAAKWDTQISEEEVSE